MVEDPVGAVVVGVGSADDADEGEVLAVGAGDGVEDAEAADGEGDDARANALGARVAVGGVAGVELVAAADEVEVWLRDEVVEECQVEVAGDGEHVPHADLHEAAGQVAAQRAGGGGGADLSGRFHVIAKFVCTCVVCVSVGMGWGL